MSKFDLTRISTLGLFRLSLSYLSAAEFLLSSNDEVTYPRLFLYGHAIELALKSFVFEKQLEIQDTHDLVKLQKDAEKLGFQFSDLFKSILKTLTKLNDDDYRTRYFKTGATAFPNNEILSIETKNFFNSLIPHIPDGNKMVTKMGVNL